LTRFVQRWIASETEPRNALRRATATFFLIEGPFFRVLGAPIGAIRQVSLPSPAPVQPRQRQSPVVGPDGDPRPPECSGIRPPPARRRRISLRSMTPHEAPLTEQDGRDDGEDGNFVKNK